MLPVVSDLLRVDSDDHHVVITILSRRGWGHWCFLSVDLGQADLTLGVLQGSQASLHPPSSFLLSRHTSPIQRALLKKGPLCLNWRLRKAI